MRESERAFILFLVELLLSVLKSDSIPYLNYMKFACFEIPFWHQHQKNLFSLSLGGNIRISASEQRNSDGILSEAGEYLMKREKKTEWNGKSSSLALPRLAQYYIDIFIDIDVWLTLHETTQKSICRPF